MDTLAYIVEKYQLTIPRRSPVEIPNTGRADLAVLFADLGYRIGAEIGTEAGKYAEVMCKANPDVKLYCVDPYEVYKGYRDYSGRAELLASTYVTARERLKAYDAKFIRKYSMDALADFEDGSLDFVYIDGNHEWPYVTHDMYYWERKVRKGGIVSGHDYYMSTNRDSRCHVKHAVNGYTAAMQIHPWFILGLKAKIPGMVRENARSWFWVKE